MSINELKEFDALCLPLVEWLRDKHDPHTEIRVSSTEAILLQSHMGAIYPYREDNDVVVKLSGVELARATVDFDMILTHKHGRVDIG